MHGVSHDFQALNHCGIDSNKKAISKAAKAGKSKPKSLTDSFEKENLGYWSNPDGKEYVSNFSLKINMSKDAKNKDSGGSDEDDQNSTILLEISNGDNNEVLDSRQNSVISEILLNAKEDDTLDSPVKTTHKVVQKKQHSCKAKMSTELKSKLEEEKKIEKGSGQIRI